MTQSISVLVFEMKIQPFNTYSRPRANSSKILTLFLLGIRSFQTALTGSIRMHMSETTLNKQEIIALIPLLRQR